MHTRRYEAAEKEASALERPYAALASLLNCDPNEIAVLSSATLAWQQAFYGVPLKKGDRILTSVAEYGEVNSNATL